jgi:hypothetical protein
MPIYKKESREERNVPWKAKMDMRRRPDRKQAMGKLLRKELCSKCFG